MVKVIGYSRIRNEALILREFLDHLAVFCDSIYVLDDASTDESAEISEAHPKVKLVIREKEWKPSPEQDGWQRGIIFRAAVEAEKADSDTWFCCLDADERIDSMSRERLGSIANDADSLMMRLFDFYITPEDVDREYAGSLRELREWCGSEYRKLIVFFRYNHNQKYFSREMRLPAGAADGRRASWGSVLHYGRAISVREHQESCDFYIQHFPPSFGPFFEWMKGFPVTGFSRHGNPLVRYSDVVEKRAQVVSARYLSGGKHFL